MDNHFTEMLWGAGEQVNPSSRGLNVELIEFIPSKKFIGSKNGYVFKNGANGVGVYSNVI